MLALQEGEYAIALQEGGLFVGYWIMDYNNYPNLIVREGGLVYVRQIMPMQPKVQGGLIHMG